MLPRHEVALLDRALLRKATQAFQKQLLPFPAAQAADCISVSCQLLFSLPKTLGTLCGTGILACPVVSAAAKRTDTNVLSYTRRRFGGRQPLCGIGVTSRITTMWSPAAASARTADSRPEPGPFTRTSTLFIPYWSRATPAAASDACCAAYGVPLRDPLKPIAPAEDQHTTRPSVSVMEICVLLNDAATYTTPCGMMRRSRFFLNSFLRFAAAAGFPGVTAASGAAFFCCSFATIHSISSDADSETLPSQGARLGERPASKAISPSCPGLSSWPRPRRAADPCGYAHWYASAGRAPADCGGAGSRDRPGFRSAGGYSSESPCGDRLPPGLLFRFPGEGD